MFDFDKDTLTPRGKEVVDNVAAQLKETGAKEVKVAGYTDRLGSDAYNLDLSQRRANRVKARLIEDGVTSEITAVGYGKYHKLKLVTVTNTQVKLRKTVYVQTVV